MLGRNIISIADLSSIELKQVLDVSTWMKNNHTDLLLQGKTLALVFEKPSLRTRVSLVKELAKCYASNYWHSHAKAASYVRNVDGNKYSEKDVENAEYAVRGELKRWNKCLEKFPAGAYCKVPCRSHELAEAAGVKRWEKAVAIVISEPRVERGGIMLDVLIAGKVVGFYARNVTMR